ncbi:hypothetical protein [Solimonas sp. K1W22B-7]|uniref:hypothetical protein n=1 Tax=Solimonas sp. K1W22B-7 TaxID=2303331 RepID=UPI0013C422DC|nr:hypothetical protein [Solimonas sp. K1W22B-7]
MRMLWGAATLSLVVMAGCHNSVPVDGETGGPGPVGTACAAGDWCVGAAKAVVSPTQEQIDGIEESRLFLGSKLQQFNLGGFGINPIQNLPNPFAALGPSLTQPAQERVHRSKRYREDENVYLRMAVVEQGETRMAFVTLDAIGAGNLIQQGLRAVVVEASCALDWCIDADHIVFGQTHTHAGADLQGLWGGVPQQWITDVLYAGAAQATREAIAGRARARATLAQGSTSDFNNYRRPRVNPGDDADPAISLLRFEDSARRSPIVQILQYAAHPTSIDEDPRAPHADYIFGAMKELERRGGIGMYYNGPIADASGSGGKCNFAKPDAYESVRCRGHDLAAFALRQPKRELAPQLALRNVTAMLPVTNPLFAVAAPLGSFNRYYDFTPRQVTDIPVLHEILGTATTELGQAPLTAETLVSRISMGGPGGLEIATIPGEATNTYGQFIRHVAEGANPGAGVMLLGLTQNSFGYILPEEEFSYIDASGNTGFLVPFTGYEEFVSMGPLTAPLLRLQAYLPLFDAAPLEYLPANLRACTMPGSGDCLISDLALQLEYAQTQIAQNCTDAGAPEAFCGLLDPKLPLTSLCSLLSLSPALCGLLNDEEAN